jgi:hypothetical protein
MLRQVITGLTALLISGTAVAMADEPARKAPTTDSYPGPSILFGGGPGVGYELCPADVNEDGQVDVDDLILVILGYGSNSVGSTPSDINEDGGVDLLDMLEVIANWGPCPV